MATHVWNKNEKGIGIQDTDSQKVSPVSCRGDAYDVCLSEKLAIMKEKDSRSLNKRTELMNKCRHK